MSGARPDVRRPSWVVVGALLAACASGGGPAPAGTGTPGPATASASPTSVASPAPRPSPSPSPSPAPVQEALDLALVRSTIEHLAGTIGPRPAGGPADAAARDHVAAAFRAAGWEVDQPAFPLPQGGTSANVVATLPGTSLAEPHVVVGGHLDTVEGSPGANDNATGVGVLVALAQELADEAGQLPVPVVLVAFGAEEYQPSTPRRHHLGSQAYADAHGHHVRAMVSVDMVGHGDVTCLCHLADHPDTLARRLVEVAEAHGLADGFRVEARGDVSDHGAFAAAGVPAVLLWTYRDATYHTPRDTPDRVHLDDVARAGEVVLAWLRAPAP